jgi:fructose-1,6-bisphosphatase/inositol monophosphatase family enzyme
MRAEPDLVAVGEAIQEVAAEVVLPRFQALAEGEVSEKGPGDLVTVADLEAEQALTQFLSDHLPGSVVVGEEAVAADPTVLATAKSHDRVWVIDPIDGTGNFVAGSPYFAVMVALVEHGRTTASWIHHPVPNRLFAAQRGAGAEVDGRLLVRPPAPAEIGDLRATVVTRLLDEQTAARVETRAAAFGSLSANRMAAGIQYPRVAEGDLDVVLYWRTLVWDQAAGSLLLEEAGGRVARLDGSDNEPWSDLTGLVLAADHATHNRATTLLAPDGTL